MKRATQAERILSHLNGGGWVCGTVFLAEHMPRYSAVIHTLRHSAGYGIEGRTCEQHTRCPVHEFRITSVPESAQPREQMTWLERVV